MKGIALDGSTLNIPLWLAHRAVPLILQALEKVGASA